MIKPLLQNSEVVDFHFSPNDEELLRARNRVMTMSNGIKFVSEVEELIGRGVLQLSSLTVHDIVFIAFYPQLHK